MDLVKGVLEGNRLTLARLLTQVENDTAEGRAALDQLFPHTGRAHLIGVTGSPGTGKSSLVNRLVQAFRGARGLQDPKVAVIAVDPSSPFTGGAILGDRVRMRDLSGDPGIFVRSMASRGAVGGLAHTTAEVVQVLDAAGYGVILIETVGAGQSEIDVARLAHTVVVVEAPGLGDDIQAIKAGILEIADILVVNKADLPGADQTVRALQSMLDLAHPSKLPRLGCDATNLRASIKLPLPEENQLPEYFWQPPVIKTSATSGEGIAQTVAAICEHREYLRQTGEWQRRDQERIQNHLEALIQAALITRWREGITAEEYRMVFESLMDREVSPYEAVEKLLSEKLPCT